MPDLDQQIADWRAAVAPIFRGRLDVLAELESHLRDDIDRLTRQGHASEAAFQLAVTRLGATSELAAEFAKLPPHFLPWLPIRLVWGALAIVAVLVVKPILPTLSQGGISTVLAIHTCTITLGYVAAAAVGVLAGCFLLARSLRDLQVGQVRSLARAAMILAGLASLLTGAGAVLGAYCPYEKSGRFYGLTAHEIGGITILLWDLAMFALVVRSRHHLSTFATTMLAGVVGNALILLGWPGAMALEGHGHGLSFALFAALFMFQLPLGCLALLPAGWLRRDGNLPT